MVIHGHGGRCAQQLVHTGDPGTSNAPSLGRWAGSKSRGGGEGAGAAPPTSFLNPVPGAATRSPHPGSLRCRRDVRQDAR